MRSGLTMLALLVSICGFAYATDAGADSLRSEAQELFQLGLNLFDANPDGRDVPAALEAWKQAAALNHIPAMYNLGVVYANGLDTPVDPEASVRYYTQAAELGDPDSMFNLAVLHSDASLSVYDSLKCLYWYRQAASVNDPRAQYNLAILYEEGEMVPADSLSSARWYLKAAEQGIAEAQLKLGTWYLQTGPLGRNPILAYVWLWMAAVNTRDHYSNATRDALLACEEELTEWQLEQARGIIEAVMDCYERNRR